MGRIKLMGLIGLIGLIGPTSAFADSWLVTWTGGRAFGRCALSRVSYSKRLGCIVFDPKARVKPGEDADVGVIETPEITPAKPFNQAVPSWNAYTPDGAYIMVDVKARIDGKWTGWYRAELYDTKDQPEPKKSFTDADDVAGIGVDTLEIKGKKTADAIKLRFELRSADGKSYPTLRFIAVNTNDPAAWIEPTEPVKNAWGVDLDVPCLSQLSVPGGNVWCSPTSTAMILGYWSKLLKRPEMTIGITPCANACFDHRWGGTGNWGFNTACAGEFKGMRAYVDRYCSVSKIESWISRGVPVVVAVDYARLNHYKNLKDIGHLMVIRGFTKDGDVVFNDPWTKLDQGQNVRKIYKRADLEYAWLGPSGSYGTAYIIYPEAKAADFE